MISAAGNITGTYNAGDDIQLNSGADINATANAIGARNSSSGPPITAGVYADAAGNIVLANSSASGMFGVNAGGSASVTGVNAGEDVLIRAGTTATLANVTAGDDLTVIAAGNITASGLVTTGAGPDGQTLGYNGNPSSIVRFGSVTSPADGSNIDLTSTAGRISVNSANAFDNLSATAANIVTSTGALLEIQARPPRSPAAASPGIDHGGNRHRPDCEQRRHIVDRRARGGPRRSVSAIGTVNLSELDAGDDIRVNTGGALTIGGAYSYGTGVDNEGDGSNIVLSAGDTNVAHAEADNDFVADVASFTTGLNSLITGGDIIVTSGGAVDLGNSTAGGVSVGGQSIAFNMIDAGGSVSLSANDDLPGAVGISGGSIASGGNVDLNAARIAITGTVSGAGALFANSYAGPIAINLADFDDSITISSSGNIGGTYNAGGDIRLNSGASINTSANAIGSQSSEQRPADRGERICRGSKENVVLTNSGASGMFGVNAGGAATLTGITAGEDLLVRSGNTTTLTNLTAGDDLTVLSGRQHRRVESRDDQCRPRRPDTRLQRYPSRGRRIRRRHLGSRRIEHHPHRGGE